MDDKDKKDSLKREMHRTAQDLAQKVGQLEGAVQDTYEEGKEMVERVVDTVTLAAETFSPVRQIRKRPLTWAGGAVAGGFVVGRLAIRRDPSLGSVRTAGRSLAVGIANEFAPELRSLKEILLIAAAKYAADKLRASKPEYGEQISQVEETLRSRFSRV